MTKDLINTIRQGTKLTDVDIDKLLDISKVKSLQAKSNYVRAGQIPKEFGFVIKGLFRYSYKSDLGKDFTRVFISENNSIGSYSAMISNTPSYFDIEAIEDSKILSIPYSEWQKLRMQNSKWNELLINLLEKAYSVKEKREREFLLLDAETRYKSFLKEYPSLEKRVKQNMIASYLGITPIALSRIRKKMTS